MAILNISFLKNLSLSGAHKLLLEEGYIPQPTILQDVQDVDIYHKKSIDAYYLFDQNNSHIDTIYYIEYCNQVPDDNYIDGRTTLEAVSAMWQKNNLYIHIF